GTEPVMDKIEADFKASGDRSGDNFSKSLLAKMFPNAGFEDAGKKAADDLGQGLANEVPNKVEKPLKDSGKTAGQGFAANASPLMLSAFTGVAALGPAALVAGAGVAVAGIASLVARSNSQVAAEYQSLGKDVSSTLTEAVAPFAGDIE